MSELTPKFFLHKNAICDSTEIGDGTRIWAFVHVLPGAKIGKNCNICERVFIENKVVIGDQCTIKSGVSLWDYVTLESGVFVGPDVTFTNDMRPRAFIKKGDSHFKKTRIKKGATLGANSTIVCGVTVGEFAFVGAGSVVTRDVAPHALVVGNPARVVAKVCFCGETLDAGDHCPACQRNLKDNSMELAIVRHSKP